jgi:hypothetical protein
MKRFISRKAENIGMEPTGKGRLEFRLLWWRSLVKSALHFLRRCGGFLR